LFFLLVVLLFIAVQPLARPMLHKIFFIVLIMFSGSCGALALISASHLFHEQWHSNAILGAAGLVFTLFVGLSILIWFHKEQSELK
jgi:hypothetical protein